MQRKPLPQETSGTKNKPEKRKVDEIYKAPVSADSEILGSDPSVTPGSAAIVSSVSVSSASATTEINLSDQNKRIRLEEKEDETLDTPIAPTFEDFYDPNTTLWQNMFSPTDLQRFLQDKFKQYFTPDQKINVGLSLNSL